MYVLTSMLLGLAWLLNHRTFSHQSISFICFIYASCISTHCCVIWPVKALHPPPSYCITLYGQCTFAHPVNLTDTSRHILVVCQIVPGFVDSGEIYELCDCVCRLSKDYAISNKVILYDCAVSTHGTKYTLMRHTFPIA